MRESENPLHGWRLLGLEKYQPGVDGGVVMHERPIGGRSVPHRFGAVWSHRGEDGAERLVRLWLHIDDDGRPTVESSTHVGFDLEHPPLAALRDKSIEVRAVLGDEDDLTNLRDAYRRMTPTERAAVGADVRRRRRSKVVNLERVADLYRQGGAPTVKTSYYEDGYEPADSTVFRWIKAAREAGSLEPRDPS